MLWWLIACGGGDGGGDLPLPPSGEVALADLDRLDGSGDLGMRIVGVGDVAGDAGADTVFWNAQGYTLVNGPGARATSPTRRRCPRRSPSAGGPTRATSTGTTGRTSRSARRPGSGPSTVTPGAPRSTARPRRWSCSRARPAGSATRSCWTTRTAPPGRGTGPSTMPSRRRETATATAWATSWSCTASFAQVVAPRALEPESTPTREQRRAELRTILQAHRQWDASASARDAVPVERHLTEGERAEIRQQLREQRSDKARIRP